MSRAPSDLPLRSCALAVLLLATPGVVRAQFSVRDRTDRSACLTSIPADSMVPVLVYVAADPLPRRDRSTSLHPRPDSSVLPNEAVIAQAVAEQIRSMLGARGDTLPSAAPTLTWRSLDAPILVNAWRDGRMISFVEQDGGDTSGSVLLTRALEAARAAGVGFVWSTSTADSLAFTLSLIAPAVTRSHTVISQRDPIQVPAFTLSIPWQEGVKPQHPVSPEYPRDAVSARATAVLQFGYVVDTLGRVEPRSIRDSKRLAWLPATQSLRDFYPEFAQAARVALLQWKFQPARLGGCRIVQSVVQTFVFAPTRGGYVPWRFETP